MNEHEKKKFLDAMSGMSEEEKAQALTVFPSEILFAELQRRDKEKTETLKRIDEAMNVR